MAKKSEDSIKIEVLRGQLEDLKTRVTGSGETIGYYERMTGEGLTRDQAADIQQLIAGRAYGNSPPIEGGAEVSASGSSLMGGFDSIYDELNAIMEAAQYLQRVNMAEGSQNTASIYAQINIAASKLIETVTRNAQRAQELGQKVDSQVIAMARDFKAITEGINSGNAVGVKSLYDNLSDGEKRIFEQAVPGITAKMGAVVKPTVAGGKIAPPSVPGAKGVGTDAGTITPVQPPKVAALPFPKEIGKLNGAPVYQIDDISNQVQMAPGSYMMDMPYPNRVEFRSTTPGVGSIVIDYKDMLDPSFKMDRFDGSIRDALTKVQDAMKEQQKAIDSQTKGVRGVIAEATNKAIGGGGDEGQLAKAGSPNAMSIGDITSPDHVLLFPSSQEFQSTFNAMRKQAATYQANGQRIPQELYDKIQEGFDAIDVYKDTLDQNINNAFSRLRDGSLARIDGGGNFVYDRNVARFLQEPLGMDKWELEAYLKRVVGYVEPGSAPKPPAQPPVTSPYGNAGYGNNSGTSNGNNSNAGSGSNDGGTGAITNPSATESPLTRARDALKIQLMNMGLRDNFINAAIPEILARFDSGENTPDWTQIARDATGMGDFNPAKYIQDFMTMSYEAPFAGTSRSVSIR